MPLKIIRNDITKVKADAIVNTANPKPQIGSGTDSAIYSAAGAGQLLAERKAIGDIAPGNSAVTGAYGLQAKYIIHTVGPVWIDGAHQERDVLRSCYANSLAAAAELHCDSVAFPLIATGVYGFPKDEALSIAMSEIGKFLISHEMTVILVVFDRKAFELSGAIFTDIDEFIDENYVGAQRKKEYSDARRRTRRMEEELLFAKSIQAPDDVDVDAALSATAMPAPPTSIPDFSDQSLEEILGSAEDTFQQRLLHLIDESGMDDVTVYKKANIDRKVFSCIRCKADYKPKKRTALAFAIALELDMPTTLDLLARAEIAFSPSSKFDLIITYFITHKIYDIYEINAALFKYHQPILGE